MDEPRQVDLRRLQRNPLRSALFAIAMGVFVFVTWALEDRDLWGRPHFWIMGAVSAVGCGLIFFFGRWFLWNK